MKAFVTGSTGFIGINLVHTLLDSGWSVSILVRDVKKAQRLFGKSKRLTYIKGDITDPSSLKNKIKADVIFNLAGLLPYHKASKTEYFETNVAGVRNLLEEVKNKKISRFVHVSTVGIYDVKNKNISEKSSLNLDSYYAQSKYQGEKIVYEYYKKIKIPMAIIKPTIAYGPYDLRPGFKDLFKLINKHKFILIGNGNNYFHTVYVGSVVEALLKVAIDKKAIGKDFIIGDEPCPTMRQLIQTISQVESKKLLPFKLPTFVAILFALIGDILGVFKISFPLNSHRLKFITENRRYSIAKAKKILKWKPSVSLVDGVSKTYEWYVKNKII